MEMEDMSAWGTWETYLLHPQRRSPTREDREEEGGGRRAGTEAGEAGAGGGGRAGLWRARVSLVSAEHAVALAKEVTSRCCVLVTFNRGRRGHMRSRLQLANRMWDPVETVAQEGGRVCWGHVPGRGS